MSQQCVDIVRGVYDLFASGNVPAVLAAMDPAIEWHEAENFPYADGNPYLGPQAVLDGVLLRLATEWDSWTVEVNEILDAGDTVVARGRYRATNRATGRAIDAQFAHFWALRDGKLTKFQQYADTYQVVRAVCGR